MNELQDIFTEIDDCFKASSNKLKLHFQNLITEYFENTPGSHPSQPHLSGFVDDIKKSIKSYYDNQSLLKGYINLPKGNEYQFDIMQVTAGPSFPEHIQDKIVKIKEHSLITKYAKSFVRSYKGLLNDESLELFRTIYKKEMDRKFISESISKIAAFDSSEQLNDVLSKIIKSNELSMDHILKTIEQSGFDADVISQVGDKLILKINDYATSESLGSSQWCISYDESNYDNYLLSISNEYSEDDLEEIMLDGSHFFVWDFNKDEQDATFQYAYTVSANGDIVAAHDKNDDCLIDTKKDIYTLLTEKEILESRSSVVTDTFDVSVFYADKENATCNHLYNKPIDLVMNSIYPLHVYRKFAEKNPIDIEEIDDRIQLPRILLEKTIEDHRDFKILNDTQVIDDIIWLSTMCDTINQLEEDVNPEPDFDEDEACYHHVEICNLEFDNHFHSGEDLLANSPFFELMSKIPHNNQHLIVKKNVDVFNKIIKSVLLDMSRMSTLNVESLSKSDSSSFHIKPLKSDLVDFVVTHHSLFDLTPEEKRIFAYSNVIIGNKNKSNKESDDLMIKSIELGDVHVNKFLNNAETLTPEFSVKFVDTLNNNPGYLFLDSEGVSADTLLKLTKNKNIIDNLSEEVCKNINLLTKNNSTRVGLFSSFTQNNAIIFKDYSFAEKMNLLYRKGIVDKDIVQKHINTSKLCFGDKENYPSEKFPSIIDYICSGDNIYSKKNNKKQMKLKF
jgi:hypothetical protein